MIHTHSLAQAYRSTVSNDRQTLTADAPVDKGGAGAGFGAHELLEAALATCINMAVRMYADEHSISLQGVTTQVRLNRSQPDTTSFEYTLNLLGPLDDEQRQQLVQAARVCPVRQTLSKDIVFKELP